MARGEARSRGMRSGSRDFEDGAGAWDMVGLWRVAGSQSMHSLISLARSVTISEKRVQPGGLEEPPDISRSEMYARSSKTGDGLGA